MAEVILNDALKTRLIETLERAAEKLDIADGIIDDYQGEDLDSSTEPFSQGVGITCLTLAKDPERL